MPGLVGGPCLSKDGHILVESFEGRAPASITAAARAVNERLPQDGVDEIVAHARRSGWSPSGSPYSDSRSRAPGHQRYPRDPDTRGCGGTARALPARSSSDSIRS